MNILFLADPNSIHDLKWMAFFTQKHSCYLLSRKHHQKLFLEQSSAEELNEKYHLTYIGTLEDFSIRQYGRTRKQAKIIKDHIVSYQIDLFHIMYAEPNALWGVFRKKLAVPIILTTRGTDVLKAIPDFFGKLHPIKWLSAFFYKKALKQIDYIVGTSSRQINAVKNLSGRTQNLAVIRTGVIVEKIAQDTSEHRLNLLKGEKYVFFPRMMRAIYDHELAIAAITLLPKEILEEYKFVFIDKDGGDRIYTGKIKTLLENQSLPVLWLNKLNQLTLFQTYKDASLVVMTPKSDGTPVTAIEAMLTRTALILPPLKYDKDLFSEGIFQFEERTPESLATLIVEVLNNKRLEKSLETAYQNALRLANRETEMNRLDDIYKVLVPEKDGS